MLVLCALRYLGRGWTIDDLNESTAIAHETIRSFIHKFIYFGSTTLFSEYVITPSTTEQLTHSSTEFQLAGLPGCIGSTDATHIVMECCSFRLRQLHLGYKKTHTSQTYNLTVNHRRRILSTTTGHPARFNDQSLILFDEYINKIKGGLYDDKMQFEFYDFDKNGKVILVKYRGCFVIVDNGYLNWSVTVPPIKTTDICTEIRFSEWIKSIRKDVECTFGILKGRFRILRYGVCVWGVEKTDQLWMTCCALHNMLLEVDGLAKGWENGVKSDWEVQDDIESDLPFALRRLKKPSDKRNFDLSGMGIGPDATKLSEGDDDQMLFLGTQENIQSTQQYFEKYKDECINVNKLSLHFFRSKLIRHFNIAFKKKEIVWPRRNEQKDKKKLIILIIFVFSYIF